MTGNGNNPDLLDYAILRTVAYGDVFDFPMTPDEICHLLIADQPASLAQVLGVLERSEWLSARLTRLNGYVALTGREQLFHLRDVREVHTQHLWRLARRYARWLARMPFVRMVALTGALAVRNPSGQNDDLDYLIVTADGRVWIARAFAILVVRMGRIFGVEVCPNYVVAESALHQTRNSLYIAHEVVQAVPLYGVRLHQRLLAENKWVLMYLPNARSNGIPADEIRIGAIWAGLRNCAEWLLTGRLGEALERWEFQRKQRQFARALKDSAAAAKVDAGQIKGHFNDHGLRVMEAYAERLERLGLPNRDGP